MKESPAPGTEVKPKPKAEGDGPAGAPEKKKVEVIEFVDSGKARNMGIALSKFNKLGFAAVIKAVMTMDDVTLGGLEGIATLLGNMPDEKEVRRVPVTTHDCPCRWAVFDRLYQRCERSCCGSVDVTAVVCRCDGWALHPPMCVSVLAWVCRVVLLVPWLSWPPGSPTLGRRTLNLARRRTSSSKWPSIPTSDCHVTRTD